jgi:hypothetical protein
MYVIDNRQYIHAIAVRTASYQEGVRKIDFDNKTIQRMSHKKLKEVPMKQKK